MEETEGHSDYDPFNSSPSPASRLPDNIRQRLERRRHIVQKVLTAVHHSSILQLSPLEEDLWLTLPDEVTLLCFAYLAIWDLCQVQMVCKMWNRIASDTYIGTQLDFSQYSKRVADTNVVRLLSRSDRLKRLNLSACSSITNACFTQIPDFGQHITFLDISGCPRVTDGTLHGFVRRVLAPLSEEPTCPCGRNRRSSSCYFCGTKATNTVLQVGPLLPALTTFRMAYCANVSDDAMIAFLEGYPQLESLCINHCTRLSDQTCIALADYCVGLKSLYMHGCFKMTFGALESLLFVIQNLQQLSPPPCFGESTAFVSEETRAACVTVPSLKELIMPSCYVSDGCVSDIIPVIFPNLEFLDMTGNTSVTSTALSFARRGLKKLKVVKQSF